MLLKECIGKHIFLENKVPTLGKQRKVTYKFKSKRHPSQSKYLEAFEKDFFNKANSFKFRPVHKDFQQTIKKDIARIKSSYDVFVFADKTNNLYKSSLEEYQKLLLNNITKSNLKSTERLEKAVNMEAKHISNKLQLENRIDALQKIPRISLKDHKLNF